MQSHLVRPLNTDSFWKQQSTRNNKAAIYVPLWLAIIAAIMAGVFGGMLTWAVAALAIGYVVLTEPRYGLYLIAVLLAVDAVYYDPLTAPMAKLYMGLPGLKATPVELLILWTGSSWVLRAMSEGKIQLPGKTALVSSILLSFLLVVGIANGVGGGGDFTTALWETRALLAVTPVMLITCGVLRERRHVFELAAVTLGAIVLMSLEWAFRYLAFIRGGVLGIEPEDAFNHDGALLVAILSVAGFAGVLWGPHKKAKLLGLVICVLAFVVVLISRRRASLVGVQAGILALSLVLLLTNWRRFAVIVPIALIFGVLYLGAFWNNQNSLGQPARVFRTVFLSHEASQRDKASNDYRRVETYNLWAGIKARPIAGHGFGVPYAKPMPLPDLSDFWPFWDYIPHNTVLWLWNKGGVLPFITFWFFLGTAVSEGVSLARRLRIPLLTATIGVCLAYLVMCVMFAYVDLGLASPRPMTLFGICIGILFAMQKLWPVGSAEDHEPVAKAAA